MTHNDIHAVNCPEFMGRVPVQLLRAIKRCCENWAYVERHYDDRGVQKFIELGDVEQLRQALILYGDGSQQLPHGVING